MRARRSAGTRRPRVPHRFAARTLCEACYSSFSLVVRRLFACQEEMNSVAALDSRVRVVAVCRHFLPRRVVYLRGPRRRTRPFDDEDAARPALAANVARNALCIGGNFNESYDVTAKFLVASETSRLGHDGPRTEARALEVRAVEVRALEVRAAEVRAAEVRALEVRGAEVRAVEVCALEVRALEVRATEVRTAEVSAVEVYAVEVRATEVRATEVRVVEVRVAEVRAAEVRAAEVRAAEVRAAEVRAAEVRAAEVRLILFCFLLGHFVLFSLICVVKSPCHLAHHDVAF